MRIKIVIFIKLQLFIDQIVYRFFLLLSLFLPVIQERSSSSGFGLNQFHLVGSLAVCEVQLAQELFGFRLWNIIFLIFFSYANWFDGFELSMIYVGIKSLSVHLVHFNLLFYWKIQIERYILHHSADFWRALTYRNFILFIFFICITDRRSWAWWAASGQGASIKVDHRCFAVLHLKLSLITQFFSPKFIAQSYFLEKLNGI